MSDTACVIAFEIFLGYLAAFLFGYIHRHLLEDLDDCPVLGYTFAVPLWGAIWAAVWTAVLGGAYMVSRGAWLAAISLGCPLSWWAWAGVEMAAVVGLALLVRARRRWNAGWQVVAE